LSTVQNATIAHAEVRSGLVDVGAIFIAMQAAEDIRSRLAVFAEAVEKLFSIFL
jgi:hypothetical protein